MDSSQRFFLFPKSDTKLDPAAAPPRKIEEKNKIKKIGRKNFTT